MYEIVFRRTDRSDKVVLTNTDPRREPQPTTKDGSWEVVKTEPGDGEIKARLTVAVVPLKT